MSEEKVREKLGSAERRISFVASQLEGAMAVELREAVSEIRDSVSLLESGLDETVPGETAVLFVDDEEMIRRIGSGILTRQGYKVLLASDGLEALTVFEKNRNRIGCVVLDLVMPEMDGMQACARLKKTSPGLPIILTTGYGEEEIRRRFGKLELPCFLRKPFTAASLLEMVSETMSSSSPDAAEGHRSD